MRADITASAGGTCPKCGHNERRDRVTVQTALPVLLTYLECTSIAHWLHPDTDMGLAMEDQLKASLQRINENI